MTQKITQLAIADGGVGTTNIADRSIDFSKLNPNVGGLTFRNKIINGKMEIAQRGEFCGDCGRRAHSHRPRQHRLATFPAMARRRQHATPSRPSARTRSTSGSTREAPCVPGSQS